MPNSNFVLLYVENPGASGAFYADLLARKPVESSPDFVMFVMDSGIKLGLWARRDVRPAATITGGGSELAFPVADAAAVRDIYADWTGRGLAIAQTPTDMDFGHTFVALDPDGHRLRVFAPGAP